jgi:hypothetical protein
MRGIESRSIQIMYIAVFYFDRYTQSNTLHSPPIRTVRNCNKSLGYGRIEGEDPEHGTRTWNIVKFTQCVKHIYDAKCLPLITVHEESIRSNRTAKNTHCMLSTVIEEYSNALGKRGKTSTIPPVRLKPLFPLPFLNVDFEWWQMIRRHVNSSNQRRVLQPHAGVSQSGGSGSYREYSRVVRNQWRTRGKLYTSQNNNRHIQSYTLWRT